MVKEVKISTEYITLGQLLKYVGIIDSGFLAKIYLSEHNIYVNILKNHPRLESL